MKHFKNILVHEPTGLLSIHARRERWTWDTSPSLYLKLLWKDNSKNWFIHFIESLETKCPNTKILLLDAVRDHWQHHEVRRGNLDSTFCCTLIYRHTGQVWKMAKREIFNACTGFQGKRCLHHGINCQQLYIRWRATYLYM